MLKHREKERYKSNFSFKGNSFLGEEGSCNRWKVIKTIRKMSKAQICPGILHRVIRKIVQVKFLHCLTSGIKAGPTRSGAKISIFSSVRYRSLFHLAQTILYSDFV